MRGGAGLPVTDQTILRVSQSFQLKKETGTVSETFPAILEDGQSRGTQRSYEEVQTPRTHTSLVFVQSIFERASCFEQATLWKKSPCVSNDISRMVTLVPIELSRV
jgi:hypothetical protein